MATHVTSLLMTLGQKAMSKPAFLTLPREIRRNIAQEVSQSGLIDPVELNRALLAIQPQGEELKWRDQWLQILWAYRAGGGSFEQALEWSRNLPGYKNDDLVAKEWNSFRPDGGIGVGTLFHFARQHGYSPQSLRNASNDETTEPSRPRYKLLAGADLAALPESAMRITGVFPAEGEAAIYGPSSSGKSFLAFECACCIAEGTPFFGQRVTAAPVVYVVLEGTGGIKQRAKAWETAHGRSLPESLSFILQPFHLNSPIDVSALASVIPKGAVVFIDTLNRATPSMDENSGRDMGEVLEAVGRLKRIIGGLVVLIHHTGKDTSKGLRGHSSLLAAMDATIEVTRNGDQREWSVAKSKDGEDGKVHPFRLKIVPLGVDQFGDPMSSCVVEAVSGLTTRIPQPQGRHQVTAFAALRPLFDAGETGKPNAPVGALCIPFEVAVATVAPRLPVSAGRRTSRAKDVIKDLVNRGCLGFHDGWLWKN